MASEAWSGEGAQARGVGLRHVEEAWAEAVVVGAGDGIASGEIDVVGDEDELALFEGGIDAAGGVGEDGLGNRPCGRGRGWGR